MKVSVDGGGLGAKKGEWFGNYIFSKNLIDALLKYDKKNLYYIYTLEKLKPRFAWSKIRLSIEEFKKKKDIFLALNQAIPFYVCGKIISFSHGLSFYRYPKFYSLRDNIRLRNQLSEMITRSDIIVVSSIKIAEEMKQVIVKYGKKPRIEVIPFGIPFDMLNENNDQNTNFKEKKDFFLFVGMDHPIKNLEFLKSIKEFNIKFVTINCPRKDLMNFYRGAKALLTVSHYESFNLPVLEALSQGCPVIGMSSAVIPELKPFVNLAKNGKDFLKLMKTIPKRPNSGTVKQLKDNFNWKNYVEKLVKLY